MAEQEAKLRNSPPGARPSRHIRDRQRLERKFETIGDTLPGRLAMVFRWILSPRSALARIPLGLLLVFGGFLGFLPILGFWMLPLGILVLAQDVPFLRRPVLRTVYWLERRARARARRKRAAATRERQRSDAA